MSGPTIGEYYNHFKPFSIKVIGGAFLLCEVVILFSCLAYLILIAFVLNVTIFQPEMNFRKHP
jgi:hypothetical protein